MDEFWSRGWLTQKDHDAAIARYSEEKHMEKCISCGRAFNDTASRIDHESTCNTYLRSDGGINTSLSESLERIRKDIVAGKKREKEEKKKPVVKNPTPEYFGTFFATFTGDGTVVVWRATYEDFQSKYHNEITSIIKDSLECAPIPDRMFVGKCKLEWCKIFGSGVDDHDMSACSYIVTSDGISSGYTNDTKSVDMKNAMRMASAKLLNFIEGI